MDKWRPRHQQRNCWLGWSLYFPFVGSNFYRGDILMGYFLYKGLKKPLIFFGLKDKYIYYALGSAVGGIVVVAILSSIFGIFGMIIGAALGGTGVFLSYKTQDSKGLYNKTKNEEELHIIPSKFKNSKNSKLKSKH